MRLAALTPTEWLVYGAATLGGCLLLALVATLRQRWSLERNPRAFFRLFASWALALAALAAALVELSGSERGESDYWLFMFVMIPILSVPVAVEWHDNEPITPASFLRAFAACCGYSSGALAAFWLYARHGWWTVPVSIAVLAVPAALWLHGDAPRTMGGLARSYAWTVCGIGGLVLLVWIAGLIGLG